MTITEISLLIALYLGSVSIFCAISSRLPILSAEAQHRVSSLDGLRGILATAVMVHHFTVSYYWHTTSIWRGTDSKVINNMGAVPVSLFFMITGYLFAGKIYKTAPQWSSILSSRVRRIFPMYLFTVALITLISFYQTRDAISPIADTLRAIGSWAIFIGAPINGFQDSVLINASVQWTLLYEAVFYLSLPLLYCLLKRRLPGMGVVVALLVLACLWPEYHSQFHNRFVKLFIVGIAVALLEDRLKRTSLNYAGPLFTVIALLVLAGSLKMRSYSTGQMLILGIPFALFVLGNSLNGLLTTRGLKILGEASFSIYLLHGIVIYCLFSLLSIYNFSVGNFISYTWYLPLVITVVSALSVLTYWGIERPFLKTQITRQSPASQAS